MDFIENAANSCTAKNAYPVIFPNKYAQNRCLTLINRIRLRQAGDQQR